MTLSETARNEFDKQIFDIYGYEVVKRMYLDAYDFSYKEAVLKGWSPELMNGYYEAVLDNLRKEIYRLSVPQKQEPEIIERIFNNLDAKLK